MISKNLLQSRNKTFHIPEICAGLAVGIAVLALAGWLSGVRFLAGEWGIYVPMAPSTALAFLLLSGGLFSFVRWPRLRLSQFFVLTAVSIVFLLGLLVLVQFIFGIDFGIEKLLSGTNGLLGSTPLGRMSPLTAISFLLESAAFLLLIAKRWRYALTGVELFSIGATAINAVVLVGYIYGEPFLYGGTIIPVALPTGIAFVLLGVGQFYLAVPGIPLLRKWSRTSMRGILLRAFLPFMLFFILLDGWVDNLAAPMLKLNPAMWGALNALAAGVLIVIITVWTARRTGNEIQRAQDTLKESQQIIEEIINTIPVRVFWKDKDLVYLGCNAVFAADAGFADAKDIIGKNDFQMKWRAQAELYRRDDLAVIDSGSSKLLIEEPSTTPEGNIITLLTSKVPLRSSQGEIIGVLGTYMNISERKQGEQLVRDSERRFRAIFDQAPIAMALLDMQGRLIISNSPLSKMVGYNQDELSKMKFVDFTYPEDVDKDLNQFTDLMEGKIPAYGMEKRYVHKNGNLIWVNLFVTMLRDENGFPQDIIGMAEDITERKQTEDALSKSESKFRSYNESAPLGVFIINQSGRYVEVNTAATEMLGYTESELLHLSIPDILAPQSLEAGMQQFQRVVQDSSATAEFLLRHKNGTQFWATVLAVRLSEDRFMFYCQNITDRKQAEDRMQRQLEHLTALNTIDRVIASNTNLEVSLSEILAHVKIELGVDAADILILNPNSFMLEYGAERGFRTQAIRNVQVRLGKGYAGRAALECQLVHIQNPGEQPGNIFLKTTLAGEDFVCYYGVPLIAKGKVKGVMEVYHRSALDPGAEWLDFLKTLAGQAAIAIENATLFASLQRSNSELHLAYDATIEGWSRALDLRDKETEGHTQRVTELTVKLARAFHLSDVDLVHVRWGALLHDIGKMGVPDGILLKPEPLTDEEWVAMKKHPTFAYEMLAPIRYLRLALDIPYCHHEKWDGNGYPRGLKGDQIPLAARIFAVVDVWDALRSDRPYRAAWGVEKVREHIRAGSGTHFDPQVVDVFLQMTD